MNKMNENRIKWWIMAEKICRREYEKCFNVDLNITGKMIYGPKTDFIKLYTSALNFWKELGDRYDKQYNIESKDYIEKILERQIKMTPLNISVLNICLKAQRDIKRLLFEIENPEEMYIEDLDLLFSY